MPKIYLHNLRGNPRARERCSHCGQKVVFWSVYRRDTLFGEEVTIPKNQCLKICSECGEGNG